LQQQPQRLFHNRASQILHLSPFSCRAQTKSSSV